MKTVDIKPILEEIPVFYSLEDIEKYLNQELCLKAVENNGYAIKHIPKQFRTKKLWQIAGSKGECGLEDFPASLLTEEVCRRAVNRYGMALEHIPKKFMTKELCFAAVRKDGWALKFVDISLLSKEEYTEICKIAMSRGKKE